MKKKASMARRQKTGFAYEFCNSTSRWHAVQVSRVYTNILYMVAMF